MLFCGGVFARARGRVRDGVRVRLLRGLRARAHAQRGEIRNRLRRNRPARLRKPLHGYCEIENLSIDNGEIYNLGDALPDKNFITAKKIEMELSPLALLRGKLRVSEFRADVPHINCIRLNNYTCNVDEFVGGMRKITEAAAGLSFSLRLETAVYTDCSASAKPISKKQNIDMSFERNGVSDTAKMLGELAAAFDSADAMFISNALLKQ